MNFVLRFRPKNQNTKQQKQNKMNEKYRQIHFTIINHPSQESATQNHILNRIQNFEMKYLILSTVHFQLCD